MGIKGVDAHLKRLQRLTMSTPETAGELMHEMAKRHAELAKRSLVDGLSGKPSTPGSPPHSVTGDLKDSIHAEKTGPTSARSVADAPHASALEFGTSKLAERPFMRPPIRKVRKEGGDIAKVKVGRLTK